MPGPKYNRDLVVADYLEARAKDPTFSLRKYCKVKGYSYKYVHRICGRQVVDAWDRITKEFREAYERRTGNTLVETLEEMANAHRALFGQTMNRLISTKKDEHGKALDASLVPTTHKDAVMAVSVASAGYVAVAQTLTGKQPMLPPDDVEFDTEWVEPIKRRVRKLSTKHGNGRVHKNGKVNGKASR